MAKKSGGFVAWVDGAPWIVKLILCIPAINIVLGFYRIVKGLKCKNNLMVVVGILWIVPGCAFAWLIDLVSTIIYGKAKFIA